MSLKTVSTILFSLSVLLTINGIYLAFTIVSNDEFEPQYWHLESLGLMLVYIFLAYFFWNFRKRIK
jgi:uncharacterized membrane protein SirB2